MYQVYCTPHTGINSVIWCPRCLYSLTFVYGSNLVSPKSLVGNFRSASLICFMYSSRTLYRGWEGDTDTCDRGLLRRMPRVKLLL